MPIIVRGLCILGLVLAALTVGRSPAWSQAAPDETLATASGGRLPSPVPAEPAPLAIHDASPDEQTAPVRDGKIHGMVEAGIGTNGYRHGAVAIDAPLGKDGELAIAVDQTQIQGPNGRRRAAP